MGTVVRYTRLIHTTQKKQIHTFTETAQGGAPAWAARSHGPLGPSAACLAWWLVRVPAMAGLVIYMSGVGFSTVGQITMDEHHAAAVSSCRGVGKLEDAFQCHGIRRCGFALCFFQHASLGVFSCERRRRSKRRDRPGWPRSRSRPGCGLFGDHSPRRLVWGPGTQARVREPLHCGATGRMVLCIHAIMIVHS